MSTYQITNIHIRPSSVLVNILPRHVRYICLTQFYQYYIKYTLFFRCRRLFIKKLQHLRYLELNVSDHVIVLPLFIDGEAHYRRFKVISISLQLINDKTKTRTLVSISQLKSSLYYSILPKNLFKSFLHLVEIIKLTECEEQWLNESTLISLLIKESGFQLALYTC